jgi:hypothetical protein
MTLIINVIASAARTSNIPASDSRREVAGHKMELPFPVKGIHLGFPSDKQPNLTSPDMSNMRLLNPKTGRVTGAQRPPLSKRYTQQIASAAIPVIAICSVATVELS